MEFRRLATASSRQKRILVGISVSPLRTAVRDDDMDLLSKCILETTARERKAFRCRSMTCTRRRLCDGFRSQTQRSDCLIPRQSGQHHFVNELASDSADPCLQFIIHCFAPAVQHTAHVRYPSSIHFRISGERGAPRRILPGYLHRTVTGCSRQHLSGLAVIHDCSILAVCGHSIEKA
ncbi:hypothetical protein PUN4_230025 [Paraburkholderia unamae]|nr:hypothetical protein PUN4_230025 [Paraburkholderia unamae]